jgi:primosomal protein N' (replication factor Y)
LQAALSEAQSGAAQILVGTQMLAKGHHFPGMTLAAILDADQGLFGSDFRSSERMAQLILQVAGRAGRGDHAGEVIIQTHQPDHPLLRQLVEQDYQAFATVALQERSDAQLPPYTNLALLRAEAPQSGAPMAFLAQCQQWALGLQCAVQLWGPLPAPMERRAGRYRAQLMLQTNQRSELHRLLDYLIPQIESDKLTRKVRWSIDVDPQDML